MKQYDVAVIGGGFSGVAAALSAAREGMSVLLADKSNALGGAAVNCLVNPFMPYHTNLVKEGQKERFTLSQGIFREILDQLAAMGAIDAGRTVFHEEYLKIVLNRMVNQAGVDVLFHSYLVGAHTEDGKLVSVTLANKSGLMEIPARAFIDATGDADLAVLCGCPYHLGRPEDNLCQPMTLCFRIANIDLDKYQKAKPDINRLYQQLQAEGKIKNPREDVLIFHTLVGGVLHFNSTRIVKRNPVDAFDVTAAEMEAREQALELFTFLKQNIDGFQNSDLLMTAPEIGVRESRMIDGEYLLTADDLIACTQFEDSIALGNYDIDIHNPEGTGTSHRYFKDGEYYSIPYRSLVPTGVDNVLVTGRCISATHEAQASIRIMPIVCCLGEAAGTAAAVALRADAAMRDADAGEIRRLLKEHGAVC